MLASLRLDAQRDPPPDPGNRFGDDPAAAALGEALFADPALSRNGRVACQTCHQPERAFSDGLARSVGLATLRRNAPSLLDVGYQRWLFWDGRADSLWSQALAPLEDPEEMGGSRAAIVQRVAAEARLARLYRDAFGPLPEVAWQSVRLDAAPNGDAAARAAWTALPETERASLTRAFANLGKALAAYQRTLRSQPSRFDAYVEAVLAGRTRDAERTLDARETPVCAVPLGAQRLPRPATTARGSRTGTSITSGPATWAPRAKISGAHRAARLMRNSEFNCASALWIPAPTVPGSRADSASKCPRSSAEPSARRACATCLRRLPTCTTVASRRWSRCSTTIAARRTRPPSCTSCRARSIFPIARSRIWLAFCARSIGPRGSSSLFARADSG